MKNIKYLLFALIGILAFTACSDDKENPIYNSATASAPTLTALSNAYTLAQTDADKAFATFTYTAANWGLKLATSYTLQTSLTEDFAKTYNLGTSTDISIPVVTKDINSILINKGIQPGSPTKMYFRILANATGISGNVSQISTLTSATVSTQVTPYDMDINYPKVWLPGDFNSWAFGNANMQYLFSFNSDNTYAGIIDFGAGFATWQYGFKITGTNGWDTSTGNWGATTDTQTSESSSLALMNNGKNITCYQGSYRYYHFTFNKTNFDTPTLTKDFSFNTLSIVGDAGSEVSGWGTKEVDMTFDVAKQRFTADVTFGTGSFKFRANHDWGTNWGGSNGVLKSGGDNLSITTAGKYRVIVNLNNTSNMTYQLISLD